MTENSMPVDTVTTSAICDHTCWPQQFPQMLFRWLQESLTLLILCVCVCVSSYLHCEWATEQQLEKDKRIQQKIKRFKMKQAQRALFFADVRMCDWFVSGDVLYYPCRHKYLVIIYLFLFIFFGGGGLFVEDISISGCACLHNLVCLLGCNCTFSTHLRAYIWVSLLTHLIQYNVYLSFQMVSGHFGLFPLFNLFHFLLCFPSVSLRWKRSHLTLTM